MSDEAFRGRVLDSMRVIVPKVLPGDAGQEPLDLSDGARLMEDLGLTSTATLELLLELEDALEIQIDVEEIEPADLASLGTLADFIAGHVLPD